MSLKKFFLLVLALSLTLSMVACGGAATPEPEAPAAEEPAAEEPAAEEPAAEEPAAEEPASDDVVEIEFYFPEGFGREETFGAMIEEFEASHPNIKVNTRVTPYLDFKPSLTVMWASDNVADIVLSGSPDIKEYAFNGALLPLDDLFPPEDYELYAQGVMQEVQFQGSVYGAPFADSAIGLYYNKDMFEAAGVEAPQTLEDAWTWEEWLTNIQNVVEVAEADQGKKVWGMVSLNNPLQEDYWDMWIIRSAGEPGSPTFMGISEDGTELSGYLDTPEAIEALKFYQDLYNEHELMPKADIPDAFGTEQAATYLAFTSLGSQLDANFPDLNWGVMPLPYFVTPITHTGSFAPSISAKSDNPEEAKIFLEWLASAEGQLMYNTMNPGIPARLDIRDQIPGIQGEVSMFTDLNREWGHSRPSSPGHDIYNTIIGSQMMKDIALGADVEEAVANAIMEAEAQLAMFK